MQDDPNGFWQMLQNIPSPFGGVIMAMGLSVVRVIYDREETNLVRLGMESLICGCLTFSAMNLMSGMGIEGDFQYFIGGSAAFFGSQTIKKFALRFIARKVDK